MKDKYTPISRKAAIKKMGKYTALTAAGTFLILNPKAAQAASSEPTDPSAVLFD